MRALAAEAPSSQVEAEPPFSGAAGSAGAAAVVNKASMFLR
jgi:hypothetical protein